ncbi:hypothetical protein D3C75_787850 [compost metagenome]
MHQTGTQHTIAGFAVIHQHMVFIMCFPFIPERLNRPGYTFDELIVADRLQNIIESLKLNGFLGVPEIGISGQQDAAQIRPAFACRLDQLQSAHSRHGNIRYEDIDVLLLHNLQCFRTGCRLVYLVHADLFPGKRTG